MPTRRATHTPIGLDIGRTALRAVQLRRSTKNVPSARPAAAGDAQAFCGPWIIVDAVQWERRHDESAGPDTGWTERLKRGLRQRAFRGRRVIVGCSSPDVEIHALDLPDLEAAGANDALSAAARIETQRLMSFEDGSAETDFWRIPRGRGATTSALGAAAERSRILEIWDLCRQAGADCRRIDAAACALARLGALLRFAHARDIWSALDLGSRAARLILCVDDVPVLARTFEAGGQKWTEKLAEGLQLSPASAELHKRDHGLTLVRRGVRRRSRAAPTGDVASTAESADPDALPAPAQASLAHAPSDELAGMITSILRNDLDQLAAEIERSYAYVHQCFPDRSIAGMMLAGGGALTRNLDQCLAQRLGIEVRDVDGWAAGERPVLRWDGPQRQSLSMLATAIGLALGEC
jgi:Tfp pilus assembly PilM family ATPase